MWFESSSEGDREHFEYRKQGSEEKKSFSQKKKITFSFHESVRYTSKQK